MSLLTLTFVKAKYYVRWKAFDPVKKKWVVDTWYPRGDNVTEVKESFDEMWRTGSEAKFLTDLKIIEIRPASSFVLTEAFTTLIKDKVASFKENRGRKFTSAAKVR